VDLTDLVQRFFPVRDVAGVAAGVGPRAEWSGPDDDDTLIERMLNSRGGMAAQFGDRATVSDLWHAVDLGRFFPDPERGYDASAADAALLAHLAFWTGCDTERMDRLMRRSALVRDKWDKHSGYMNMSITGAIGGCQNVYQQPEAAVQREERIEAGELLSIAGQIEYFEGCCYVIDAHRVLTSNGVMLTPERFKATYGGREFIMSADGTRPTRNAFEAFTENRAHQFPKAATTSFKPSEPFAAIENDAVNVFKRVEPVSHAGDVTRFTDLLAKLLPVRSDRDIILAWMSACVQHQGSKFLWAPVLQGTKGNGKSTIGEIVRYCIGQKYVFPLNPEKLGGTFNDWIEHKLLITVDEIHMEGRRALLDTLKPLITDATTSIEAKNQSQKTINHTPNWFFTTNYKSAVIKERDDRRLSVFFTAQQCREDMMRDGMGGDYFPQFYDWLRAEGFAALHHWLLRYVIPAEINPALDKGGKAKWAPDTSSTAEAVGVSLGIIEQEIIEQVESGAQGFMGGWVSSVALDRMFAVNGFRAGRARRGEMLEGLGYASVGRASQLIMQEDGKRPTLYAKADVINRTTSGYLTAQGYGQPRLDVVTS
jgi:hypothetical protein